MPTIHLTPVAKSKLEEYLSQEPSETAVRILVEEDGKYGLSLDARADGDQAFAVEAIPFVIEEPHLGTIEGLKIDYLDQGAASGFSLTGGTPPRATRKVLRTEPTPNPNAMKFVLSFSLGRQSRTWTADDRERMTPVVQELFALPGVESVFELDNFVTITRRSGVEWSEIIPGATESLGKLEAPAAEADEGPRSERIEDRLEYFVRTDVAPFLQQDGGDIEFLGYEPDEGVVKVRLVGACGTCPSSLATLQFGVERRLKEEFPEEVKRLAVDSPLASAHQH